MFGRILASGDGDFLNSFRFTRSRDGDFLNSFRFTRSGDSDFLNGGADADDVDAGWESRALAVAFEDVYAGGCINFSCDAIGKSHGVSFD